MANDKPVTVTVPGLGTVLPTDPEGSDSPEKLEEEQIGTNGEPDKQDDSELSEHERDLQNTLDNEESSETSTDETVRPFCIKPGDRFAAQVIALWIRLAEKNEVNTPKIEDAKEHLRSIKKYQEENGSKIPD